MNTTSSPPKNVAVILAGAVAKGAFEAGALSVLVRSGVKIVRVVAASSGALNGAMLAAGVHADDAVANVDRLVELWRDHAAWTDALHLAWHELASLRGFSDQTRLLTLLRDHVRPVGRRAAVHLDVIVAPLRGSIGDVGGRPATTYEHVMSFENVDFETDDGLAAVFGAVTASSSFPVVFAPTELPGLGPTVDGGVVNNTPIKYAIDDDVDTVVVISPTVELGAIPPEVEGVALIAQLAEMLTNERLYRDIRQAYQVNAELAAIDALGPAIAGTVKTALGWEHRRQIEIVEIRPLAPLRGTSFEGFISRSAREEYIAAGIERARAVLGA